MPASPTKRRPITVSSLLDAAELVFAERGFHGASIGDICAQAGLTRGAFYSNFADKDELFFALLARHDEAVLAQLDADLAKVLDADDPIRELGARLPRYDEERRRWFLISQEFTLHAIRDPQSARRLVDHADLAQVRFSRLLATVLKATGREATIDLGQLTDIVSALVDGASGRHLAHRSAGRRGSTLDRDAIPALVRALSRPVSTQLPARPAVGTPGPAKR